MFFRLCLIVAAFGTLAGCLSFALVASHGVGGAGLLTWILLGLPFVMLAGVVGLYWTSRTSSAHNVDRTEALLNLDRRLRAEADRWRSQLPQLNGKPHLVNLSFDRDPIHSLSATAGTALISVADFFSSLREPRLVVLGLPGAGKSVLARELQRQLLTRRDASIASAASPLPVLVSAGSCEPGRPWTDWLAGYLARAYAVPVPVAEEMAIGRQILPIIDGLDELGPSSSTLISSINASDSAVVITCRSADYDDLPRPLENASLVRIEALSVESILSYLPGVTEVTDAMRDVLSQPRMLSLADIVYRRKGASGSPSDLAALPDATAVERVLLSEFVASVYPSRGARWPRERAERWLVSIGEQMRLLRQDSYTWRSVARATPPGRLGLAGGAATATALLALLLLLGLADGAFRHGHPVRDGLLPVISLTVAGGGVAGLLVFFTGQMGHWVPNSGPGRAAGWWVSSELLRLTLPLFRLPVDAAGATSVQDDLRRARWQALATALFASLSLTFLAMLLIVGLVVSGATDHPPSGGIGLGVCYCVAVTVLLTPWGTFQLGRAWYATRHLLPYRLMGFLEDAQQRGVLRPAGALLQFRDFAVRDYITDPARLATVRSQIAELTDWVLAQPEIGGSFQYVRAVRGDIEQAIAALASRTISAGVTFTVDAGTRQAALEQVRIRLNELSRRFAFDRSLLVDQAPGLGAVLDPSRVIRTETMADLSRLIDRTPSSSVGISGLRGIGKSTLIRWLCVDRNVELDFPPLGVLVSAPVEYDAREFLVQLYISLCEAVLSDQRFARLSVRLPRILWSVLAAALLAAVGTGMVDHQAISHAVTAESLRHALWSAGATVLYLSAAIVLAHTAANIFRRRGESPNATDSVAVEAEKQVRRLRYQLTETTGQSVGFTGHLGITLSGTRSRAITEKQMTLPELVGSYRKFASLAVSALQERAQQGRVYRGSALAVPQVLLVVGIDEIDRIEEAEKAEKFLNDVKAIFGIPNCFYAASLSADALANFERRVVSTRTAFDTTFDTVLRVGPLDLTAARGALERRAIGMPYPFIALCYVLSGGVPRELMRVARSVFEVRNQLPSGPDDRESVTCGQIAFGVIKQELLSLRLGQIPLVAQLNVSGAVALVNLLDDTNGWPSTDPEKDLAKLRAVFANPGDFVDETGSLTEAAKVCDAMTAAAYLFLTVGQIFGAELDQTIRNLKTYDVMSEEEKAISTFTLLARARGIIGVNPALAITRVHAVRALYGLDQAAPPLLSQS